jgi:hypothetical protein
VNEETSWIRETHDEGRVLTAGFRVGFDDGMTALRRERDQKIAEVRVDREEHLRIAETLLELERRIEDDYDTRIGVLADAAEKEDRP